MPYSDIYLYSPLSPKSVQENGNRSLLLQFIFSELIRAKESNNKDDPLEFVFSSPACFFPYDWSYEVGCLNKICEHARLLEWAFPKMEQATSAFSGALEHSLNLINAQRKSEEEVRFEVLLEQLQTLYLHLLPFLIHCRNNESLIFFLLQNGDDIAHLAHPESLSHLLRKMFPEGLEAISHIMKKEYRARGFNALLPEIDRLLTRYE